MGVLIDVRHPEDYMKEPTEGMNIYADKLLLYYKNHLVKGKRYYIYCKKGFLSRKVVTMLEYLGYDVTQVVD